MSLTINAEALLGDLLKNILESRDQAEANEQAESEEGSNGNNETSKNDSETAAGSVCDIKNLYQKIDQDGNAIWVDAIPEDLTEAAENAETLKFALLVRNKKSYDSRKSLQIDSIVVQSPLIKKALEEVFDDYPGITTTLDRLTFTSDFRPFVYRWHKFEETLAATADQETKKHLELLHKVLHSELKDTIAAKKDLIHHGVITFEHLWTLFEPNDLVYTIKDGHERIFEVNYSFNAEDNNGGSLFTMSCSMVDWNGEMFGTRAETLSVDDFEGTNQITRLSAFPLRFHPEKDAVTKRLLQRGRLFEQYQEYHFMDYKGIAQTYGLTKLVKQNVESRIIIDCASHNKFNPEREPYVNSLVYTTPAVLEETTPRAEELHNEAKEKDELSDGEYDQVDIKSGIEDEEAKTFTPRLSERQLLLSVPFVRGYALKSKKWYLFFVEKITPITWSNTAYQSLVLPNDQKELILAFAESQVKNKNSFDDVIQGKGKGMILLLSGPPGVGKTLTAESVAETMRVPLYMMSAGDLGLDPSRIEAALSNVLEMVAKWDAVLLLDEADVFLEERSTHDLERNKMVSIFLRMLEYHEGILFLTTNRIDNIDKAFHSRIHITMKYPDLTIASRRQIWSTFLSRTNAVSARDLDELAKRKLNGRQIKNVLKTAQLLAARKNPAGKVTREHIDTILKIEEGNQQLLKADT